MNPVAHALADGVKPLWLAVAAHEVGHGIVWRYAGFPIEKIVLETGLFGGLTGAYCRRKHKLVDARNIDGFLIGLAAGTAAQIRCATEQLGHGRSRATSDARAGNRYDRDEFHRLARAHRSRLSFEDAQRQAAHILNSRADVLDRLTGQLARTRRISGGAL